MKKSPQLTAFEQLMLALDSPQHPMVFCLRVLLSRKIGRTELECAVNHVASRHHRLRSQLLTKGRRSLWGSDFDHSIPVELHAFGQKPAGLFQHMDLSVERAVRVSLSGTPAAGSSEVWFQFHHAGCDGLGAVEFMHRVFAELKHAAQPSRTTDIVLTEHAGRHPTVGTQPVRQRNPLRDALCALNYFHRAAHPLIGDFPDPAGRFSDEKPATISTMSQQLCLPPEAIQQPRSSRDKFCATINDGLLEAVFQSLADHQLARGAGLRTGLRIGIPMSLRAHDSSRIEIQNEVSMAFLDRRLQEIRGGSRLLSGIAERMKIVKRFQLGKGLLASMGLLQNTPRLFRHIANLRRTVPSAIVSNLGAVHSSRQAEPAGAPGCIQRVELFPPVRAPHSVSFGCVSVGHLMTLSLTYDTRLLSVVSAGHLLRQTVERLDEFLGRRAAGAIRPFVPAGIAS